MGEERQWGRGERWGWEDGGGRQWGRGGRGGGEGSGGGEGRTVGEGGQRGAVESGRKRRSRTVLGLDTPCYPSPKALIKVCRSLCSQRPTASYQELAGQDPAQHLGIIAFLCSCCEGPKGPSQDLPTGDYGRRNPLPGAQLLAPEGTLPTKKAPGFLTLTPHKPWEGGNEEAGCRGEGGGQGACVRAGEPSGVSGEGVLTLLGCWSAVHL